MRNKIIMYMNLDIDRYVLVYVKNDMVWWNLNE